jgi:hypothetical protein
MATVTTPAVVLLLAVCMPSCQSGSIDAATTNATASDTASTGDHGELQPPTPTTSASAVPSTPLGNQWVSLFDGESLNGWVSSGGRYDGKARWTVEDGVLVGRQGPGKAGGLIYTETEYQNFLFRCEAKIDYPFDSGIFLRMLPRPGGRGVQVTIDHRPGGEIGGLYADGFLKHNEAGEQLYRRDEWNLFEVRCVGEPQRVTAWLNGELLVEHALSAADENLAERGLIGLQVHGGADTPETQRAMFRNMAVVELPIFDAVAFDVDDVGMLSLTAAGSEVGWAPLFNGLDLTGWDPSPDPEAYRIDEGVLSFPLAGGTGELRTRKQYRDFELVLDFKIARMANSGLFLRSDPDSNRSSSSGCEVQILDDFHWEQDTGSALRSNQFCGSLYAAVAPAVPNALRPLGSWNTYQIRYVGERISVKLNGHLLYDVNTHELAVDPPFADRVPSGFVGLQRHAMARPGGAGDDPDADYAWFRNMFVRELEP